MTTVIEDKDLERRLRRHRKRTGADRYDEAWDGVYVMAAMPNDEHQDLVCGVSAALWIAVQEKGRGVVRPGINVSDQPVNWKKNYRCPDIAVLLNGSSTEIRGTHWYGGPDLAIEIVSPGDRSRSKLPFYAKVKTREVLVLDRDPWRMELFRLAGEKLVSVGAVTPDSTDTLRTETVPFTWRLVAGASRPQVEIVWTETGQRWAV